LMWAHNSSSINGFGIITSPIIGEVLPYQVRR
jgi:hypothetical protein